MELIRGVDLNLVLVGFKGSRAETDIMSADQYNSVQVSKIMDSILGCTSGYPKIGALVILFRVHILIS